MLVNSLAEPLYETVTHTVCLLLDREQMLSRIVKKINK